MNLGFSVLVGARSEYLVRLAAALGVEVPPRPHRIAKRVTWHRDLARAVASEIQRRKINDALGRTRARGGWET